MTPVDLKSWMATHGYNTAKLHCATGVAKSTILRYVHGKTPIPTVFELALKGLEK